MPIEKEKFTADDAEQLFCQVRNIDDAAEAAKIFIERTSPPNLEGESFFNMTERTLLQSLIEYQRLYGKPQPHKMICQSVYQKYKQKAPTSTGGEMNAFRAQHDVCSQTVRKEVYSGVPR